MLIDIQNESNLTFILDGDWLSGGDWKTDRSTPIEPHSRTLIEIISPVEGGSGILWWVDASGKATYLSLAWNWPLIGRASFLCSAGQPPANLKAELGSAARLEPSAVLTGEGCTWSATAEGVKVTVNTDLKSWSPPTAADYAAGRLAAEKAKATAEPKEAAPNAAAAAAAGSNSYPGDQAAPPAAPASTSTELADPEAEAVQKEASAFMAQTRPKDFSDGLLRGLKTTAAGVGGGIATAVASPVLGAKQEGAIGFVKGLGVGLFGGVAVAVAGTACGVAQVARGIGQSHAAHVARKEEKVWDQELGGWVDIDLCAMEHECEHQKEDGDEAEGSVNVKETDYYDMLKIAPGARPSEIKKAYYKEARSCHPDKNPGDTEATAKFQKLSEVYQVLSDAESRKKYDREGAAGVAESKPNVDPAMFFSLLFGSERFVPWTGELNIAMQTDHFAKAVEQDEEKLAEEADATAKELKGRQLRREVACAVHLREKLDRWVYGRDQGGFEEQMRLEAHDLASAQFGPELLAALGEIYQLRAEIYLANEMAGRFSMSKRVASLKHNAAMVKHGMNFYTSAAGSLMRARKVYSAASAASKEGAKPGVEGAAGSTEGAEGAEPQMDEEAAKGVEAAMDEALPGFLQTAWSYVVRDIDSTMKQVGRKILQDKSVPWQIRIRRAQALRRLGAIFSEEATKAAQAQGGQRGVLASETAKAALQEALVGSMRDK